MQQPITTYEIMYGGARGGGKTDAGQVWLTGDEMPNGLQYTDHPRYRALVIRKNADDLADWLDRASYMYKGLGAVVVGKPAVVRFPSGALFRTGHLRDDQAYTKYQGHEYQRMLVEELTQIATEKRYLQLIGSCRSTIPELRPQVFTTTNPGGPGHMWVKDRFVDNAIPFQRQTDNITGLRRIFIPARIDDNPTILQNDPYYVMQLEGLQKVDPELYKAWRLGSWDVFAGQMFREWSYNTHVTSTFEWPLDTCTKIITFDWGYEDMAAAHWIALSPENAFGVRRAYVYRELYFNHKEPEEWAQLIQQFTRVEDVHYMVLPHDCFAHKTSKNTIADVFSNIIGVPIRRGDTLSKGARVNRVAMTHRYLGIARDGKPYMQIHPSCHNIIRTLPSLVRDEKKIEDVDTTQEDHAYDSLSLGLITLGYTPKESTILVADPARTTAPPVWRTTQAGEMVPGNFWQQLGEQQPNANPNPEFWQQQ